MYVVALRSFPFPLFLPSYYPVPCVSFPSAVSAFVTYQEELAARTRVEDLLTATRPGYIQQGFVSFGLLTSKFKWVGFGFFENTARTGVFPFGFVRFHLHFGKRYMCVLWNVYSCLVVGVVDFALFSSWGNLLRASSEEIYERLCHS